ncbi:MAG TPA: hypothetical protein VK590_02585 [Saprospiraceae bacterium]|nr:hypothetical protein [Saprospiraceae bacterium]
MTELSKSDVDKLLQTIRKVPPHVVGTPLNRNEFIVELAEEISFKDFVKDDYKMISLELFELLEDIEKAEALTVNDPKALCSLVKELTAKRFIYLSKDKSNELKKNRNSIQ